MEELIQFVVNTDDILYQTRAMTKDNASKGQAYHRKTGVDSEKPKIVLDSVVNLRKKEGRCIKCGKEGHCIISCPVKGRAFLPEPMKGKKGETGNKATETDEETSEVGLEN